jgi:hypothetical protein
MCFAFSVGSSLLTLSLGRASERAVLNAIVKFSATIFKVSLLLFSRAVLAYVSLQVRPTRRCTFVFVTDMYIIRHH